MLFSTLIELHVHLFKLTQSAYNYVVFLSFIASPFFNAHERKIEISELQVRRGGVGWSGVHTGLGRGK